MLNYPYLCFNMHARNAILHNQQRIIVRKAHIKFQPDCLKAFQDKVKKVKKNRTNYAQSCMPQTPPSLTRCVSLLQSFR